MTDTDLIGLTADIVASHVSHNTVAANEVSALIRTVHEALARAGEPAPAETPAPEPAVPVRQSIRQDHLVCLEDGKKLKMLKRYLRTNYDMSPDEYQPSGGFRVTIRWWRRPMPSSAAVSRRRSGSAARMSPVPRPKSSPP